MAQEQDEAPDANTPLKAGNNAGSGKMAAFWKEQIKAVDKAQDRWYKRGKMIVKRFRDERTRTDEATQQRRMNLLWANYRIMKPALYSKQPTLVVDRTFLNRDPTGRLSSQIIERAGRNELEYNGYHKAVSKAVNDYLLPGRGQTWVRYEPKIGASSSIAPEEGTSFDDQYDTIADQTDNSKLADSIQSEENEKLEDTGDILVSESAPVDYIDWMDFYQMPATARTWDEVQAVGKKFRITKHEAKERFGEDIAKELKEETSPLGDIKDRLYSDTQLFMDQNERSIEGYEIWSKTDRTVYWICEGYTYLCKVEEDPLELDNFFPCPEPISSTLTNDNLIPVPDYIEWQDQAIQIDELTQRINMLTKACKIAGAYDATNGALKRIFSESVENQLIPVDNWAAFAEKGGTVGGISLLPIEEIIKVIETLTSVRQTCMQDLDIITGINDIMRGTTDSRETLGGIRLKNNNTGTRLSERQNEVARFARDTLRIVCEIMCKHFAEDTLIEMSGVLLLDELQPETLEELLADAKQIVLANAPPAPPMGGPMPGPQLALPNHMAPTGPIPAGPPGPQSNVVPFPHPPQQPAPPQAGPGGPPPPQMGHPPAPMGAPPAVNPNNVPLPPQAAFMPIPRRVVAMGLGLTKGMPCLLLWQLTVDQVMETLLTNAIDLLRNDVPRKYRIDIETDSTIYADREQERENASEFVESMTKYLGEAAQVIETMPEAMPLIGKTLQFAVRKFRTGRDLEACVDDFVAKMEKKVKDLAKNPPPNPEIQKQQLEMQKTQYEIQAQRENDDRDAQKQAADDQREMLKNQQEDQRYQHQAQLDQQMQQQKHAAEMQKMAQKMEIDKMEHQMRMAELQAKHQATMQQTAVKVHAAQQQHSLARDEHAMQLEQADKQAELANQQHKQKKEQQTLQHQQKKKQIKNPPAKKAS